MLDIARERFPGEFWAHFRTAVQALSTAPAPDAKDKAKADEEVIRYLTAALAIRPQSAIARAVLGMVLIERRKDERAGRRMIHSAAKADPTSPWPHLFIGMHAMKKKDWPEAFRAMKESVRVDPDIGFFMTSFSVPILRSATDDPKHPTDGEIVKFCNELIAIQPKHPGGYDLLGKYYLQAGDHRSALARLRKAKVLMSPDYPGRIVLEMQVTALEAKARWEGKLPAVLRGEIKPKNRAEVAELAGYCATFEKKFARATRFVTDGIKADPKLLDNWFQVASFAGWAVQAGAGNGADGADLTPARRAEFRRQALAWMRETTKRAGKRATASMGFSLTTNRDFAPVRDAKELAKLPAAERAEWEKLWAEVKPPRR